MFLCNNGGRESVDSISLAAVVSPGVCLIMTANKDPMF